MKKLINKIKLLEKISEDLEPTESQRADYHDQMFNFSNDFINTIDDRNSFLERKKPIKGLHINGNKKSLKKILKLYNSKVTPYGINASSGGHIGYIPGGGIYTAAIGDYIADVSNEYAGVYYGSPGAVTIENEVLDWLKGVFHFPKTAVGNLTSGGSIANLIALTSARDKFNIKGKKIKKSVIYLSPQTHHCIDKALRIIGLEDIVLRYLKLDKFHRVDANILKEQIKKDTKKGLNPFMVIASAGTTDTGAVDPLKKIGGIAKKNKIWFHVDGAYGGLFILAKNRSHLFEGIEMADSLVIDPHKGLFLPYGTGAVLVKDKEAVLHSHHYTASYMQDSINADLPISPAEVSPELTKHFRGLRLWLPLKLHGVKPFIACLEEKILLTDYFRKRLIKIGFKLGPKPDLSVSYFWYPSKKMDEDKFNEKLMKLIHKDGRIFLSSSTINNRYVIRMAVLSFRTKKKTIDKAIDMIEDCLKELKK
jgi:aromatic-L-amino-acid decarboxylase